MQEWKPLDEMSTEEMRRLQISPNARVCAGDTNDTST